MIELKPISMRSMLPVAGEVDFGKMVEELLRSPPLPGGRPYVACNFISTLDGRATMHGRTEQLGFKTDARVVMRLRTFADAVIVGAGTMRVERYDRMLPVARLRQYREQIGLAEDPLTVIVTDSMKLPWDAGLFTDGYGDVLLATSSAISPPATQTHVDVLRQSGGIDFAALLVHLHRRWGIRSIVCEGGPTMLSGLTNAGLVDDLFLTLNPVLVGDSERGLIRGGLRSPVPARLAWVLEAEGELFTRWHVGGVASD